MKTVAKARLTWALFETYVMCARPAAMGYIARRIRTGEIDARLGAALQSLFAPWPCRASEPVAQVAARVEQRRAELSRRLGPTTIISAGGRLRELAAPHLAFHTSVPPRWGRFLFHCASGVHARTIVEVGACIGISGSYLAATPSCRTFVTFEPSVALAEMAAGSIREMRPESQVVPRRFDDGFDGVTSLLEGGVDLAYIDSAHDEASTIDPVTRLTPYLHPGSILLFDDIRWSPLMWRSWQKVRQRLGTSLTIDLGRMGLCVWEGSTVLSQHHDLSRFLGWWRVQGRRVPVIA